MLYNPSNFSPVSVVCDWHYEFRELHISSIFLEDIFFLCLRTSFVLRLFLSVFWQPPLPGVYLAWLLLEANSDSSVKSLVAQRYLLS